MNRDDFENNLQRQSLRQLPATWHEEILAAAHVAAGSRLSTLGSRPSWLSILNHQLSAILWPSPKAWAGLAAVWLVILAANLATRDGSPVLARSALPPSPTVLAELRQQRRLLAELIGQNVPLEAEPAGSSSPRPRSEALLEVKLA
jgi:hypothetical protein